MSYIDISIIVIVSLCALAGLKRGLFKSAVSCFGWILSLIVSIILTKIVAYALLDVASIQKFVLGTGEGFSLFSWTSSWMPDIDNAPTFLQTLINPVLENIKELSVQSNFSIEQGLALFVTYYMFSAMVLVALFIVIKIIIAILLMFIKTFDKGEKPSGISRLLGFAVSAAQGIMYVGIIFLLFSFFAGVPKVASVSQEIEDSMFGKPVYEQVEKISARFLKSEDTDTFTKLVILAGFDAPDPSLLDDGEHESQDEENEHENEENEDENQENESEENE